MHQVVVAISTTLDEIQVLPLETELLNQMTLGHHHPSLVLLTDKHYPSKRHYYLQSAQSKIFVQYSICQSVKRVRRDNFTLNYKKS